MEPKDFIKMKSGLVLRVLRSHTHAGWTTATALGVSGQLYYLDSRRDTFELLPDRDAVECCVIFLENKAKGIDRTIAELDTERVELRKLIAKYREKLSHLRANPIEDYKYD